MEETIKKLLIAILFVLIVNTLLIAGLLFGGTSTAFSSSNGDSNTTESSDEEATGEYDTSRLKSIDYNKFKELYNGKEKSIVLFARATCGYCVQFMPILNEVIDENNLNVYYLDITTMSDDDVNNISSLDSWFEENYGYTPTLVVVSGGKIVDSNVGYVEKEDLVSFLEKNSLLK